MGLLLAYWRRFFGGADSKFDFLEKRGIQCIILIALIFCWEFFIKDFPVIKSVLISVFVYIFWSGGHFYYFKCGTESDAYIDEQEKKGRKPAMNWLVAPVNKKLGFAPRSRQYCFVGMMIRYTTWAIPVAVLLNVQFFACAFAIPFIYNAMFWVQLPKTKYCKNPTNWAEWFSGLIIGWALI